MDRREAEGRGLAAILGASVAMHALKARVARLAPTTLTVLIEGETGTGKELVARALHESSPRRQKPFVPVNCGALSAELVDSELFGHERGAFTGATAPRAGRVAEAAHGTLFLDEIGELAPPLQAKLLRLLQEGELQRVGTDRPIPVDVRIVAATNRDLHALVEEGRFRADCYYRLSASTIHLPPLRARGDDVVLLADALVGRFACELGRPAPRVGDDARALLGAYPWPGNVRELENVLRESVLYCEGPTIRACHVQGALGRRVVPRYVPAGADAADLERVLGHCAGNVTRAARALGISRPTLYKRMRERGLDWTAYRPAPARRWEAARRLSA
jgi:transcriptional regulator with GAF, ATPase, and Fis domain